MIRSLIFAIVVLCGVVVAVPQQVSAIDLFGQCNSEDCAIVKEKRLEPNNSNVVMSIMRVVLGALGGISVIMIVIGGIRFAISNGDPAAVASAKKTILYAVIGLVVAMMASGIVMLVAGYFA